MRYGKGQQMSISKDILKRIKIVEDALNMSHCPELIMIDYNTEKKKYLVNEIYTNSKGRETKRKQMEVDLLSEYVFAPDFMGVCIMDLFNAPVPNPNLYVLRAEEVRKEEKIACGVGFRIAIDEEQLSDRVTRMKAIKT